MRIGHASLIMLLVFILVSSESRGQTADSNQFQTFTKSDFYKRLVGSSLRAIPEIVFKQCPALKSGNSNLLIIKPVSFGQSGYPNGGAWKQTFPVSGCGNDTILNLYFFAGADEKVNTAIGIPGTTLADPILQRDAVQYANIGSSLAAKDCKLFLVKNTKFESFGLSIPPTPDPGPSQRFRPWWETWTMVGCNRTFRTPMNFIPDAKGTRVVQPGGVIEQ